MASDEKAGLDPAADGIAARACRFRLGHAIGSVLAAGEAGKHRLRVAPGTLIERIEAGGERDAGALALLDHDDGAGREPAAAGRRGERPLGQALAVGRIEESQREAAVSTGRPQLGGVAAEDLGDARQPERLDVAADEGARFRFLLDEQTERGARATAPRSPARRSPRTGRSPWRPPASNSGTAVRQDVEDRLAHAVRGRPRALVDRRGERPAAELPADDPHRSSGVSFRQQGGGAGRHPLWAPPSGMMADTILVPSRSSGAPSVLIAKFASLCGTLGANFAI